jgi:hypothetical protein
MLGRKTMKTSQKHVRAKLKMAIRSNVSGFTGLTISSEPLSIRNKTE